jgi:hypothetical protein
MKRHSEPEAKNLGICFLPIPEILGYAQDDEPSGTCALHPENTLIYKATHADVHDDAKGQERE